VLISGEAPTKNIEGYSLYSSAKIKEEAAKKLYAKNRQSGMNITDGGINKKIKKLMCDKKVPLYDRDTLPLVCSGDSIIYAPLCAVSDNAKARGGDKITHIGIYQKIGG
jgi:tRNA(Ile)-lysidine synthetase-like protein